MGQAFYDELASAYHLIFDDWDASMRRQGEVLAPLLPPADVAGPVLDCACGIGTQAIAVAARGYAVEGSDPSEPAVARARLEAEARGFAIDFRVDDMRTLATAPRRRYGIVAALDNAVPHLESDDEILDALSAMRERLRSGGRLLLSLRDYGKLMTERPLGLPPLFFRDGRYRRIVHQVWDWQDERCYTVHLYITRETAHGWEVRHFVGRYRAVTPEEVAGLVSRAGFTDVEVMAPAETGYHQPIVRATAPNPRA